jgi:hypothetical protein
MISKVIYFVDRWVRLNVGPDVALDDAETLARRCMDDAERAGFTTEEIEEDLGTDLVDFLSSELEGRGERTLVSSML